jgi:hypothetical protein
VVFLGLVAGLAFWAVRQDASRKKDKPQHQH